MNILLQCVPQLTTVHSISGTSRYRTICQAGNFLVAHCNTTVTNNNIISNNIISNSITITYSYFIKSNFFSSRNSNTSTIFTRHSRQSDIVTRNIIDDTFIVYTNISSINFCSPVINEST